MKAHNLLLVCIIALLGASLYFNYENTTQIKNLHNDNIVLWHKLDSVQTLCNKQATKKQSTKTVTSTGNALVDVFVMAMQEEEQAARKREAAQKVTVSSKYRLEDRYSSYIRDPETLGDKSGEVELLIKVSKYGDVKTAKLSRAQGITDEEVIESCKKAALKSSFNSNYDAPDQQEGTITYVFKRK